MRSFLTRVALLLGLAASIGCATTIEKGSRMPSKGAATGFLNKTMAVDGHERRYVVYVPSDYTPKKTWPLILFLHGAGERGDDGLIQTEVGIGRAIRRHADRFPCIVVMPQCPRTVWWDKAFIDMETALSRTEEEYAIDPKRVYLTGLSLGGFGTWTYGALHADRFAALMPICGGGNPADAEKLARLPIWAFHGADDQTVPPAKSEEMVDAIRKANGNVQYTVVPNTGHNSWDAAYDNPETIKWLLEQRSKR
jgi:predicted peptidase